MPIIRRFAQAFKKIFMSKSTPSVSEVVSMDLGEKGREIPSTKADEEQKGKKRSQSWRRDNDKKKKKKKEQPQRQAYSENLNKARKVAMFIGYSGKGYRGIQFQREENIKTIEGDLFKALIKVGLIEQEHIDDLKQMLLNVEDLVPKLNEALPEQIRVYGYVRATKGFDCKKMCTGRTYIYLLPTLAFAPMEETVTSEYRVTDNIIDKVSNILQRFIGTHNFHNYTSQVKYTDSNAKRYIVSFKCSKPFITDGMEFAQIRVDGQSFMLHQIRKMIGITIAIVKGHYNMDALDKSWGPEKLDVPIAPGLGLVLESLHFIGYNRNFGSDGCHEPITWEQFQGEMEDFKEKYIIPEILKTEKEEQSMMNWLAFLINHSDVSREDDLERLSRSKIASMAEIQAATTEDSSTKTQDGKNENSAISEDKMTETESGVVDKTKMSKMDLDTNSIENVKQNIECSDQSMTDADKLQNIDSSDNTQNDSDNEKDSVNASVLDTKIVS